MQRFLKKMERRFTHHITSRVLPGYKVNYRDRGLINFIDVGSAGRLPHPWLSHANTIRLLLKFDPNESALQGQDPNIKTYPIALWETDADLTLYIVEGMGTTGASLFKPNIDYVKRNYQELKKRGPQFMAETWFERSRPVGQEIIRCRKLDDLIRAEFPSTPFHFMKVDTQGAELNILKGAESVISGSCLGLHLELFTLPLYEGIALLDEVESYLAGFGYRLAKKNPAHGSFDSQHDCLFLKEEGDPRILSTFRKLYKVPG